MRAPEILLLRWLMLLLGRSVARFGRRLAEFSEAFLHTHRSLLAARVLTPLVLGLLAVSRKLASINERLRAYWESGMQ